MESDREEGELSEDEVSTASAAADNSEKSTPAPNNSPASTRLDDGSRDSIMSSNNNGSVLNQNYTSQHSHPAPVMRQDSNAREPTSYRDCKVPGLSSSESENSDDDDYYGSTLKRAKRSNHSRHDVTWQNPLKQRGGGSFNPEKLDWGSAMHPSLGTVRAAPATRSVNNVWGSAMAVDTVAKPAKKNNVWGDVMQEQKLEREFGSGVGMKKIDTSERDVESYDFTTAADDDRSSAASTSSDSDSENSHKRTVPDLTEVETFGYESDPKKNVKSRLGKRKHDKHKEGRKLGHALSPYASGEGDREKIENRKRRFGDVVFTPPSVKDRLGAVGQEGIVYPIDSDLLVDDPAEKIVSVVAQRLNEPKVDLLAKIQAILGNKMVLRLLSMTQDIEESGGMLIMNGLRRRTPGGVYLTLLKNDPKITQEDKDAIFEEDKKAYRKKIKARRRKHRRPRPPAEVSNTVEMADEDELDLNGTGGLDDPTADIILE